MLPKRNVIVNVITEMKTLSKRENSILKLKRGSEPSNEIGELFLVGTSIAKTRVDILQRTFWFCLMMTTETFFFFFFGGNLQVTVILPWS